MDIETRMYKFEAIVRGINDKHDCEIWTPAKSIDSAWVKATTQATLWAIGFQAVLVAMSFIGIEEDKREEPFDGPYKVESPLYDMTFEHRN